MQMQTCTRHEVLGDGNGTEAVYHRSHHRSEFGLVVSPYQSPEG